MGCVNPKKRAIQAMASGGMVEAPSILKRSQQQGPPREAMESEKHEAAEAEGDYCVCPKCGNGHRNRKAHSFTRDGDM